MNGVFGGVLNESRTRRCRRRLFKKVQLVRSEEALSITNLAFKAAL